MNRAILLALLLATIALNIVLAQASSGPGSGADPDGHEHHMAHGATTLGPFRAEPDVTGPIPAGRETRFTIAITDSLGAPVDRFDIVHEKPMHLIVVSDDLGHFAHLHPEPKGGGTFAVNATFPAAGRYVLYCDYRPTGGQSQVSLFHLEATGAAPQPTSTRDLSTQATIGDTFVRVTTSPAVPKAGEETTLSFALTGVGDKTPVSDLQPYLGAMGHLVVVRDSGRPGLADYIHAHALPGREGVVVFAAVFPGSGAYRLFAQFNRGGTILTVPFWLRVD